MDYDCGNFGDCSFSRFGFIVRTNRHKYTQTDANERFTPATVKPRLQHVARTSNMLPATSNMSPGLLPATCCLYLGNMYLFVYPATDGQQTSSNFVADNMLLEALRGTCPRDDLCQFSPFAAVSREPTKWLQYPVLNKNQPQHLYNSTTHFSLDRF